MKILALCLEREMTNKELREKLNISKPLLIMHLKMLLKQGLLEQRVEFDENKLIVRKYYKTKDFEIRIGADTLKKILKTETE